jgi:general secretion pathway protein D
MSSTPTHLAVDRRTALLLALLLTGCANATAMRTGRHAEQAQDYDRAIAEYTKVVRADPANVDARAALNRVKLRASQEHANAGRRLEALDRFEEAVIEYQVAAELNPTNSQVDKALRDARQRLKMKVNVSRDGRTDLENLIDRTRDLPPPGLELPDGTKLPSSLVFGTGATSRAVFMALAKFANINLVFDPAFRDQPISIDLRNVTLEDALNAVTASTHTFFRVTAPRTITIVPDSPSKRREYEEAVVRTFYLSNADLKEVIDLLRVVIDIRQISQITATNAISIKDTPERIAAAAKLISAIDKARPEVIIDVELLEVNRTHLQEYGLQIASPNPSGTPTGINGSIDINRENFTLANLQNLTAADVFLSGIPGVYYRLLKNDTATRTLANPQLRTSDGITAQARFGDEVPIPVTTFAPIAAGGINQQPITSFNYRTIGVNIDITPRLHHDDQVTLALKVSLSTQSGTGFGGLPTFGNREITTTIRLKDGETNMLAGLIRDEERTSLAGVPGLSDLPVIGHLFAYNHKDATQTDIILTLTPHIVRVLDLSEADLRPFRLGRDSGSSVGEMLGGPGSTPRQENFEIPQQEPALPTATPPIAPGTLPAPAVAQPPPPAFPQPLQGPLPGTMIPVTPPAPKKPGGGGSTGDQERLQGAAPDR